MAAWRAKRRAAKALVVPPFRMGRAVPSAQAGRIFAGIPVVWNAGLVGLRLQQLARLAGGSSLREESSGQGPCPVSEAAARECGILHLNWATTCWDVRRQALVRVRGRSVIPCPRCARPAWRLHATGGAWSCWRCQPTACIRTEILLADYVCGLRIGLYGVYMAERRARLLARLRTRHLLKGKTPQDLLMLTLGGPVLRPRPTWERSGYKRGLGVLGPVWQRLAPQVMSTAVDHLLHPDAYLARYGKGAQ